MTLNRHMTNNSWSLSSSKNYCAPSYALIGVNKRFDEPFRTEAEYNSINKS